MWWVGVFHSLASYSYLLLQQCKGKGKDIEVCNVISSYCYGNSNAIWDYSVTCHPAEVTFLCVCQCVCVFHNSACYSYCLLPQCVMTWEYSVTCHPAEVTFLCVCKRVCVWVSVFYNSACYSYCSLSRCICVCDCISAVSVRRVPTS